jgi:hypothetical protein
MVIIDHSIQIRRRQSNGARCTSDGAAILVSYLDGDCRSQTLPSLPGLESPYRDQRHVAK